MGIKEERKKASRGKNDPDEEQKKGGSGKSVARDASAVTSEVARQSTPDEEGVVAADSQEIGIC